MVLTTYELFGASLADANVSTFVVKIGCSADGCVVGVAGADFAGADDGHKSDPLLSVNVFVVCDDDDGHNSDSE